MNAIIEAAKLQGSALISRRAWSTRGTTKVHLWELSTGGCIILRHEKGAGFQKPVRLDHTLDALIERFRGRTGNKVFSPDAAR